MIGQKDIRYFTNW